MVIAHSCSYYHLFLATFLYQKKIMKGLTEEEFKAGYRKAQLIDVREPNEFEGGHILGARNIPFPN